MSFMKKRNNASLRPVLPAVASGIVVLLILVFTGKLNVMTSVTLITVVIVLGVALFLIDKYKKA